MKKLISTLFLCGVIFSMQAVQVTFRVDMTNQTVSGAGVHLAGGFGSNGYPQWSPGGIAMSDANADNIYEVTLDLTANQTYQYKFINGNSWGSDETAIPGACNVGGNRQITVGNTNTVLLVVCFNQCSFCSTNPQFRQVTFRVDMQNETVSPDGVHLAGTFHFTPAPHTGPEWNPGGIAMTDLNADQVYEVTLTLAEGYGYQYKFVNGNEWSDSPEGNILSPCGNGFDRTLTVGTAPATTLPEVCFNSCSDCIPAPDPIDVTFRVDMQNVTVSPNGVRLAGSFGGNGYPNWDPTGLAMTDANLDGVYEITLTLTEGLSYEYKFINGNNFGAAELFNGPCVNGFTNRFLTVGSSNTILNEVCFNSCSDCTPIYDVTFRVNMNFTTVSPNGVHLAGSFGSAGYDEWNPGGIAMLDGNADGIYEVTLSLPTGATYQYKYVNGNDWNQQPEAVPAACGLWDGFGNYNRTINPTADGALPTICFGGCSDCIGGCMDANACNYSATANVDNGSCTYAALAFFIDADGDGFGSGSSSLYCANPGAGFSAVAGDCNDNNANIYPNASELCSNNTDDDCDGTVNEGCPAPLQPNDNRNAAVLAAGNSFPTCGGNTGSLVGATVSGECFTSAPSGAGQDVWYRFVAQTNGVRIQASSTSNDLVIELQNSDGSAMIHFENETTSGIEVLTANNLTPGQTYFVAIRNFNTASVGTFTYCIQHLAASQPNNGTTFSNLCGFIKSRFTGASLYTVTFNDGVNAPISGSNTSTQVPFSMLPGVRYNTVYSVVFTTTYTINDAAGNPTTVVVNSNPFTITIQPHNLIHLRLADRCPTSRALNNFISTDAIVCRASSYQWEAELVDELNNPISLDGPSFISTGSRFLKVNQIPGAQAGQRYRIRVRPMFTYGEGNFAPAYQYLCIAGPVNMETVEETTAPAQRSISANVELGMNVYPNPNRGDVFTLTAGGLSTDQVFIRIMDVSGREVYNSGFAVDGMLNAIIQLPTALKSGIYMIELSDGTERFVQRMIVE